MSRVQALEHAGHDVPIFPDAETFIQRQLVSDRVNAECDAVREQIDDHPLRTELLNAELLPYQLDGIAFSAGAGRAILADDTALKGLATTLAKPLGES